MHKVLIVDDDSGVRGLLCAMINRTGDFDITETDTLAEATVLCSENRYDLIFLDHHLSDGIGWDLAELISLDPEKYGYPLIVAMSGSVFPGQEKERRFYSEFLHKPVELAQISEILEKLPK